MIEIVTRSPLDGEIPALRNIWDDVFGSEGLDSFFFRFYDPNHCVVAEFEKIPAASGYLVPFGTIKFNNDISEEIPCAMIYSVAVLPEYRSMGLGTAVVNELICRARKYGFPAVVLCPSDDGLFEYYRNRTELVDWFYTDDIIVKNISAGSCNGLLTPVNINTTDYNFIREELLKETVHIKHDLKIMEYQEDFCTESGGGLFQIGDYCTVVERQSENTVWIKELLAPAEIKNNKTIDEAVTDVIYAISSLFPADRYLIRLPSFYGKGRRFGMLALDDDTVPGKLLLNNMVYSPWYGMAFD